jgi:RNA polymerase sigma factor (sigma-70 family)
MKSESGPKSRKRRPYMMAVVLGTALSAFGQSQAQAAPTEAIQDISRYCTACWRNARLPADRWGDCTQEVFRRLLDRVPTEEWSRLLGSEGEERREFLRAIDAVKKRTQRDARRTTNLVSVVSDSRDSDTRTRSVEREAVAQAADELLTDRQKQILQMSFEGWSVHDMAAALTMPAERISDEKYKAIGKLRAHFCRDTCG